MALPPMTRTTLAALAAAALLATPASAGSGANLADPKGDWPVPSEDFTKVHLDVTGPAAHRVLRAAFTLTGAPDAATQYEVSVSAACAAWTFSARNIGTTAEVATMAF